MLPVDMPSAMAAAACNPFCCTLACCITMRQMSEHTAHDSAVRGQDCRRSEARVQGMPMLHQALDDWAQTCPAMPWRTLGTLLAVSWCGDWTAPSRGRASSPFLSPLASRAHVGQPVGLFALVRDLTTAIHGPCFLQFHCTLLAEPTVMVPGVKPLVPMG